MYHPRPRQDAFDGYGLDSRHEFKVAFHAREIERQQVFTRLDAAPSAELIRGNHTVAEHFNLADRERFIVVDEPIKPPLARSPEDLKPAGGAERNAEDDAGEPGARGAHLARAQLHIKHVRSAA